MDSFRPLAYPPTKMWQRTPPMPAAVVADYRRRRQELDEHPYFFNGTVTAALGWYNDCLKVAPVDYATAGLIASGQLADMAILSVRAIIINDLGQMLWPRRGPKTILAGYWEPGAGGSLDQANAERVVCGELREELNIDVEELPEGALRFEGVGEGDHSLSLIWSLKANHFEANPEEVTEAVWLDPPEQPEPILPQYGPVLLNSLSEIAQSRAAAD